MSKITALEAQVLAGILWEELAERGCDREEAAFNKEHCWSDFSEPCPLCEYANQYGTACSQCVIAINDIGCNHYASAWTAWSVGTKKREAALRVLDAIFGDK